MQKWKLFEYESCRYHERKYNCKVWHWDSVPESVLYDCGFITSHNEHRLARKERNEGAICQEYGLDAIAFDGEHYHGIQCKQRTGTLCASALGTFLSVFIGRMQRKDPDAKAFLYHTSKLERSFALDMSFAKNMSVIRLDSSQVEVEPRPDETSVTLREPQVRALEALKAWDQRTGLLNLPCGVGKTTVFGHYLRDTRPFCVVIVSPLKELAHQNGDRLRAFLPDYKLDERFSDGERAIDVKAPTVRTIFTTTYDSFELSPALRALNAVFIVDEAHNLRPVTLQLVTELPKCFLMTATPTTQLREIAGVVFEYSMREAINDKFICEYEVDLPIIDDNFVFDTPTCCSFLASGMLENGSTKCIVYCSSKAECDAFVATFVDFVKDFHGIKAWAGVVTADTKPKERKRLLRDFAQSTTQISILTSVRILNEGIDIPECDSVCFTKTTTNKITAIQRLCRANRLDVHNPHKMAHAYVFAEMDACVDMLAALKHEDPELCKRVRMVSSDYNNKKATRVIEAAKAQVPLIVERVNVKCRTHTETAIAQLNELDAFCTKNKRRPFRSNEDEKRLGILLKNTIHDYKNKRGRMADPLIRGVWETISKKHSRILETNDEKEKRRVRELRSFIVAKNRLPRDKGLNELEKHEQKLGKWYDNVGRHKTELLRDLREEFPNVFLDQNENWNLNFDGIKEHVEKQNRLPRQQNRAKTIDASEVQKGKWLDNQLQALRGKGRPTMSDERKRVFFAFVKSNPGVFPADILQLAQRFDEGSTSTVDSDETQDTVELI